MIDDDHSTDSLPSPVILEFLILWREDRELGKERTLADYLSLFPRHQEIVAAEYLRLSHRNPQHVTHRTQPEEQHDTPRFERGTLLGQGGMGRVFTAFDHRLERRVALKYGQGDPTTIFNEAVIAGGLRHPNIPAVHDLGFDEDGHFYVMDHIEGTDLRRILQDRERGHTEWTQTRLLNTFAQACNAMSYAHSQGVFHLDLKPANIMTGEFGELYIVDWGLAHRQLADGRSRKAIQGTPAYMSPEQARGMKLGAKSDVFSLGVILYEVLTGRQLFAGGSVKKVLDRVLRVERVEHREWDEVPIELQRLCDLMLAMEPKRRPAARRVSFAIQEFLEGTEEKRRRSQAADQALCAARKLLEKGVALESELTELAARVESQKPDPWAPQTVKRPYWRLETRRSRVDSELRRTLDNAMLLLIEAHRNDPFLEPARELLAQRYWTEFEAAERRKDSFAQRFYEQQLRQLPAPEYDERLSGEGELCLKVTPRPQGVSVHPIVERDRIYRKGRALTGHPTTLPMGAWNVEVERRGYRPLKAPIFIARGQRVQLNWKFRKDSEIGKGFLQIPPGVAVIGGGAGGSAATVGALTERRVNVKEFCISEFPVTVEEYLLFVQDLARSQSRKRAVARLPRIAQGGAPYDWIDLESFGVTQYFGSWRHKRWPVFGISWFDATAYVRWRSKRDGRRYSLPSDEEWEKAARGTDGRQYPWGEHFDAGFCKNLNSRKVRAQPEPVGSFRHDCSPYGVRDMAGGMKEWCRSWFSKEDRQRLVRGGSWNHTRVGSHCCYRNGCPPDAVYPFIGLRLVHHYRRS